MIKSIVKDNFLLSQKSIDATSDDYNVACDLLDTVMFEKQRCVGMAANMIGVNKRIITYLNKDKYEIMYNPIIMSKSNPYKTKEGCLCHIGEKEVIRYKKIKVQYYDYDFKIKIKTFTEFQAQIIQHEMDHLEGILI